MESVDSINNKNYSNFIILHSSNRGIVCQASDENNTKVILKNFVKSYSMNTFMEDPETNQFLPKEYIYLNKLSGNDYVPKVLNYHDGKHWSTIVIEFLDGDWMDLFYYTELANDEISIRVIMKRVINIMYEMSMNGFYHRDIKPENIMVNKMTLEVKLIDLEDVFYSKEQDPVALSLSGTMGYRSPESFINTPSKLKPNLVFNIGCTLYSCLELDMAFETQRETILCRPLKMPNCSKSAANFISSCVKRIPNDRISFDLLLNHEWFISD